MRRAISVCALLVVSAACLLGNLSCSADEGAKATLTRPDLTMAEDSPAASFLKYYEPVEYSVEPAVAQYDLPLDPAGICNFQAVPEYRRPPQALDLLRRNGFVVMTEGSEDDIISVYDWANDKDVPVFITVDTLLHLYHIQFDQTLKSIEEREFHPRIVEFSKEMLARSEAQYETLSDDLKEAARRNVAYFAVGLGCLGATVEVPGIVQDEVTQELQLIGDRSGFSPSPIFKYKEDYSQYQPRGHYTRSEALKQYFKGLMWYGRISMLMKGQSAGGMIPDADAKIQTLQACLIAKELYGEQSATLLETWQRIYGVTAFYVGLADDLTPAEYAQALKKVVGASFEWTALANDKTLFDLKSELATFRAPEIYGGTGEIELLPPFSPEQLNEVLDSTQGLRLMGQRFIPDAYVMQNMIFPALQGFTGQGDPFTMEDTAGGKIRAWSRGLDVMAVLGSERAADILTAAGDTAYENYDAQLLKLHAEFAQQTPAQWNRNLYGSWLYSLQALLEPSGAGYPTFMQGEAYRDRSLWAALSSWAQLRHDTILYAKQPYGMLAGAMPPGEEPPPPPPGYVEPVPEFYARMLALARMTRKGLDDMQVLDEAGLGRLTALEEIIGNLLRISIIELKNEAVSQEDADYIKYIGRRLEGCIEGIDEEENKTTMVADVLTDPNTGQCLEEGVGYVKVMMAAYKLPDGRVAVGFGPVLSHYEFKHPMADRLTDEKWRTILPSKPPAEAEWTKSFYTSAE